MTVVTWFLPQSDCFLPSKCRKLIERGALVAVNHSGGKDSQCMTILLARLVPRDQLLVVHAPLGDMEWPGTIEHIENTIPSGVPFILAPVASGKSLLQRVEERGKWPDSARRWCTSDFKVTPIERELRRFLKARPRFEGRLVSAIGLRRDESAARAKRVPWKRNDRNSRAGREPACQVVSIGKCLRLPATGAVPRRPMQAVSAARGDRIAGASSQASPDTRNLRSTACGLCAFKIRPFARFASREGISGKQATRNAFGYPHRGLVQ